VCNRNCCCGGPVEPGSGQEFLLEALTLYASVGHQGHREGSTSMARNRQDMADFYHRVMRRPPSAGLLIDMQLGLSPTG